MSQRLEAMLFCAVVVCLVAGHAGAQDYMLTVDPTAIEIVAGEQGQIAVGLVGSGGFASGALVTMPAIADVTFNPNFFILVDGQIVFVVIDVAPGATPRTEMVTIHGTASPFPNHDVSFMLTIVSTPNFELLTSAPTIEIPPGGSGQMTVTGMPVGAFSGNVSVQGFTGDAAVTVNPQMFTLGVPGPGQNVTFSVGAGLTVGQVIPVVFYASGGGPVREANVDVIVGDPPDFQLMASPDTVEISPGATGQVAISGIPLNGFSGNVNVTGVSADPSVTVSPSSFALPVPGSGLDVNLSVGAGALPGQVVQITFTGTAGGGPPRQTTVDVTVGAAPDFQLMASPDALEISPGSSRPVTVTGLPLNGFNGTVNVSSTSADPSITVNPGAFNLAVPGAGQSIMLSLAQGAVPGSTIEVTFTGTSGGGPPRKAVVEVTVGPQVDFMLDASPPTATAPAGTGVQLQVSATPINSFTGTVSVTSTAPSRVSVSPASFSLGIPGSAQSVDVQIGSAVPPGQIRVTFEGSAPGVPTRQATVTIEVTAAPDFNLSVSPPLLDLTAGDGVGSELTIDIDPVNDFNGIVTVTAPTVPGLTFDPASFNLSVGGLSASSTRAVRVLADRDAQPGEREIVFSATAPGIDGSRTSQPIVATILQPPFGPLPVIDRLTPGSVVQGSRWATLLAEGRNFVTGATAISNEAGIRIEQTVVLDSNHAELTISSANNVPPGGYEIGMRNPDGGESVQNGMLLVYPPDSLAAPLGVAALAIVYPVEGTILGSGQEIFARGLIAATGTGTITGVWRVDGIAFDQFIADVAGGEPIGIESGMPIPDLPWGEHSLELVVENPAVAEPARVRLIASRTSAAGITIFAPRDGAIVGPGPKFRWSLVPGAASYEIEFSGMDDEGKPVGDPLHFRRADAEWSPTDGERSSIGTGGRLWRVRAIFPGGAASPPTEWQRVVFAPESVTLVPRESPETDVAAWEGDKPGLLYRFRIIDTQDRANVLEAWSFFPEYRVPFEATSLRLPEVVEVIAVAVTPWGKEVGRSVPIRIVRPKIARVSMRSRPAIASLPEGRFATVRPVLRATWAEPIPTNDVRLLVDGTDVTGMTRVDSRGLHFRPVFPLSRGVHRVAVFVGAIVAQSSFEIEDAVSVDESDSDVSYLFNPMLMVDWKEGTDPTGRVQISTKADVVGVGRETKWTGDVSFRGTANPSTLSQESRNWLVQASNPGVDLGASVIVGLTVPAFTSSAEYLVPGVARTSVTAKASNRLGAVSFYQPIENELHGVASSGEDDLSMWGFAVESKPGRDSWARLIGLVVEEKPSFFAPGSKTETVGLLGNWVMSPRLTIAYEAAHGKIDDHGLTRSGEALRLGMTGRLSSFRYGLILRHTDPSFVNPANRGITHGGFSDRTSADLNLSRSSKGRSLNMTVRLIETGRSSESTAPETDHASATISYSMPLGSPKRKLVLKGNAARDHGEGDPTRFLSGTDRTKSGLDATLQQTVGAMRFSQTLGFQSTDDDARPTASQEVSSLKLGASGKMSELMTMSALASFVRTDRGSSGTTDNLTVSFQPRVGRVGSSFSLSPVLQYRKSENDVRRSTNETTQLQTTFLWAPKASILSAQLAAHWNWVDSQSPTSSSSRHDTGVQLGVTLSWRKARGM